MKNVAPVLLPFLLLVITGWRGLDYGAHWDEPRQFALVEQMIISETLLPGLYNYPSIDYWIDFAGLLPELSRGWHTSPGQPDQRLIDTLHSHQYLLRIRAIHLVISSLAVIWIYLLVLAWGRSGTEALLASSLLALSWQVAYHLRWAVTDGVVMQFAALTALLLVLGFKRHSITWLRLAAIAAGFAVATKYTAGLLIIPVLAAGYSNWKRETSSTSLTRLMFGLAAMFLITYLICTPGTLLQPVKFMNGVLFEFRHYTVTGHRGHTLPRGPVHAWYILVYLSAVLFSRSKLIALFIFACSLIGGYAMVKENRRVAVLFFCFPVLYLLFFSMQRVMFARNLLAVAPFLAIAGARGIVFLSKRLSAAFSGQHPATERRLSPVIVGFGVLVIALMTLNGAWLIYAAETIAKRSPQGFATEAASYLREKGGNRFFISPKVRERLIATGAPQLPNVTDNPTQANSLVFYATEATNRLDWPEYTPNLTEAWFGPYEVDFNYYPDWAGEDRIVVMSAATARKVRMDGVSYAATINSATFVAQTVPAEMIAGQTYNIAVTMRNTGTTTWTPAGLYNLGSQDPEDNVIWSINRVPVPQAIAPGATVTFNFSAKAPPTARKSNFRWRMVQDHIEWFGDSTPSLLFESECPTIIQRVRQNE